MSEPRARRPTFGATYGISDDPGGMIPWSWATERLTLSRSYWIATTRTDGSPHVAPVWGLWVANAVVFSTSPASRKARNLARDPRVAVHLESGDEVVIVEGTASPFAPDDRIADAYAEKYEFRPDPSQADGWFRVPPRLAYAWREKDFPESATRFDFA